jgi:hypothetical protein
MIKKTYPSSLVASRCSGCEARARQQGKRRIRSPLFLLADVAWKQNHQGVRTAAGRASPVDSGHPDVARGQQGEGRWGTGMGMGGAMDWWTCDKII